ncbi:hypothetical protein GEMRC1_008048 [Eukaryota sp. GEM-RC1]
MSFSAEQLAAIQSQTSAPDPQNQQKQEQQHQAEEQRRQLLSAILEPDARERLNRIALVKPEKAQQLENMILHLTQTNKHVGSFPDSKLVQLLEQLDTKTQTSIRVKRRTAFDEDDDLGDLDELL